MAENMLRAEQCAHPEMAEKLLRYTARFNKGSPESLAGAFAERLPMRATRWLNIDWPLCCNRDYLQALSRSISKPHSGTAKPPTRYTAHHPRRADRTSDREFPKPNIDWPTVS